MTLLNLGLDNVEMLGKRELLPIGVYERLECISAKVKQDPNGVYPPKINCTFIDANAEVVEGEPQKVVYENFGTDDKFKWLLKNFLITSGSGLENESELDTEDMIGLIAKGEIERNDYVAKKGKRKGETIESTQVKWLATE